MIFKELYIKFINENPDNRIGYGIFVALKPFYVRPVQKCDIEMCCCKKHLHARWALKSLLECTKKQKITVPFSDYNYFFEYLYTDCEKSATPYIFVGIVSKTRKLSVNMLMRNGKV